MPKKIDVKKTPNKPKTAKGYKIPERLPTGTILTDCCKKKWKILKSIGYGGFGELYLVLKEDQLPTDENKCVLKLEPYTNGPLFTEINFYKRVAKAELIRSWMVQKKLNFLGIPLYIGSGSHEYNREKTRFLIMPRFGLDIQQIFDKRRHLSKRTVLVLAIRLLDILEYIHSKDFVHADVKGSNILLGYGEKKVNDIHLIDYGLATKYKTENGHKEYREDPRKSHDGTIEYTSLDAHRGVSPSRRSDLQILGYNLIHWLSGTLPWISRLENKNWVFAEKVKYKENISGMMDRCFPKGEKHRELESYFEIVMGLDYEQKPPYTELRSLFENGLHQLGSSSNKTALNLWNKTESYELITHSDGSQEESDNEQMGSTKRFASKSNSLLKAKRIKSSVQAVIPKKKSINKQVTSSSINFKSSIEQPEIFSNSSPLLRRSRGSYASPPSSITPRSVSKTPNSVKNTFSRRKRNAESTSVSTQTTPGLKRMCSTST